MDKESLTLIDMDGISEAILTMVTEYPDLPFRPTAKNIQWQSLDANEGIGLATLPGAIYIKKYTRGAFVGQMPFQIAYRDNPTNNKTRLQCQDLLEDLAKWIERSSATFKSDSLKIQRIERTSPVYKAEASENGTEVYMCSMNVRYYAVNPHHK